MQQANPERFHLYHPPDDPIAPFLGLLIANLIGASLFYQAANQVMVQRILSARSTWDGIMGVIFAGLINRLRPLVTCFLGLVIYHWIHEMKMAEPLSNRDNAFPLALQILAPEWGLRGIILAGFLAAIMSTIGALSNSTATIFSIDVYKKRVNRSASDRQLIWVGRSAAMMALMLAALVSPVVERMGGIFIYFQKGITYLAIPFISVMLLGIFWKRTNNPAALFAVTIGTVISMLIGFGGPSVGLNLHWIYLGFFSQTIIIIGMVIISLLTSAPTEEQWRPFKWKLSLSLLTGYGKGEEPRPWYKSLILWFVVLYGITIVLYWIFW